MLLRNEKTYKKDMDSQPQIHGELMSLDILFKVFQIFREELADFRKEQTNKNDELSEHLAKARTRGL